MSSDDDSSQCSFLSRSPTPPSELYPSPPPSQHPSTKGSPLPDNMEQRARQPNDDGPPRKKRRVAEPKPRVTRHLDLSGDDIDDSEPSQREALDLLLKVLHKKRKIVMIVGAGISVSAGIPDFRSSTGLFNSLRQEHNLKTSGKDLFDASVYRDPASTATFHQMVRSLSEKSRGACSTDFHHLIATLADEGRLLRLYSQNVDGLETALGPLATETPLPQKGPWPKTVLLHGGLEKMFCVKCKEVNDFNPALFDGPTPPECEACAYVDNLRTQFEGKRSHGIGRLRPRMVLYNENGPDEDAIGRVTTADLRARPDAVIVVGTTLKVPGVRRIAREMINTVRDRKDGISIWVNNEPEPKGVDLNNCWDLIVRGPCDAVAKQAAMRRWDQPVDPKEITDEEYRKIARIPSPKVLVPISPRKKQVDKAKGIMTPSASPKLGNKTLGPLVQTTIKPEDSKVGTPQPKGRKKNPAAGASKKTQQNKKPSSKKKATEGDKNKSGITLKLPFKQSKAVAQAPAKTLEKEQACGTDSKRHPTVMAPVSPQSAKNNTAPPYREPLIKDLAVTPKSSPRSDKTISPTGYVPNDMLKILD
ncbi:DHS-like NAD/FAD-binding domain-containing protein [Phyllosticta citribraziliensis]|uniref:DHS-like NAD/FAD-binding domain-containing protein n=1 Tax=Phyllosticta citribraziliensis TaxID=989973 RepID=A0ABR1LMS4_9PEZI